jgi:hypothetical protein
MFEVIQIVSVGNGKHGNIFLSHPISVREDGKLDECEWQIKINKYVQANGVPS